MRAQIRCVTTLQELPVVGCVKVMYSAPSLKPATTFFTPLDSELDLSEQAFGDAAWPSLSGIETSACALDLFEPIAASPSSSDDPLSSFILSPSCATEAFHSRSSTGRSSTTPTAVDSPSLSSRKRKFLTADSVSVSPTTLESVCSGVSSSSPAVFSASAVNRAASTPSPLPPARNPVTIRSPDMSAAPLRPRPLSKRPKPSPPESLPPLELANGLVLTDNPPGKVGRYLRLSQGAWQVARVLLYKFGSFPRLWQPPAAAPSPAFAPASAPADTEARSFQYNWVEWLERLSRMRTDAGAWRDAALALASLPVRVTAETVEDAAKAVIELSLRDAEVERATLRARAGPAAPAEIADERAFMARARTAKTYAPRAAAIQRCFFAAIETVNANLLQRIAEESPPGHLVRELVQNGGF